MSEQETRRDFVKKAWVAPAIASFAVTPSMARAGSVVEETTDEREPETPPRYWSATR